MFNKFLSLIAGIFFVATSAWAAVEINTADQAALDGIQMTEPVTAVYARDYAPLERLSLESYVVPAPPN